MAKSKIEDLVTELAVPIVENAGMELVDVEYVKEGAHWYLRVFIDKPQGVSLDDCQMIAQRLDPLLDEKDPIPHEYMLEVSSPGLDRPLKKPADFARYAGRKVKVSTYAPIDGKKEFIGELKGLIDNEVVIGICGTDKALPLDKVSSVRLEIEF
ncbi:ribosome maturation factor RimP [Thermincola potens]|uniref:Ribosome maturation factor RimP n=1 Tax=Thermincola potens (strain JR) TaxID=635013 RepID=D5XF09_THEPJ|nr:ribosome maturation factor RimP [Thermincola potens]ADG82230.1 protein of unknown function DUF150 [Thermincola potens JR]